MTRLTILILAGLFANTHFGLAQKGPFRVVSPGKKIEARIDLAEKILFSVSHDGQQVIAPSPVSLVLDQNRILGAAPVIRRTATRSVAEAIVPLFPKSER